MFVASVLFDDYDKDRLIKFLHEKKDEVAFVARANLEYNQDIDFIKQKREEYKEKIVVDIREWCKRWNIDFRDEDTGISTNI